MRVLIWHVHGSWTTAFVQGRHTYVVPTTADRGPDGRGRAQSWSWPAAVIERRPDQLAHEDIDVIVLQRPEDEVLARRWLGRRPGRDVPAVWLEHNAPQSRVNDMRHPAADRDDLVLVHVTHTNALFWDAGHTKTDVVEHGIIDPGHRYTGEVAHSAVVINEPARRARVTGTDLLAPLARAAPVDLFGMEVASTAKALRSAGNAVHAHQDLDQATLHAEMAKRRVYAHPIRWTSLGLSLIEAMALGMPVVALATTEVPETVPPGAGVVTNRVDRFVAAVRERCQDPDRARAEGEVARQAALDRHGLDRFLQRWDEVLHAVVSDHQQAGRRRVRP